MSVPFRYLLWTNMEIAWLKSLSFAQPPHALKRDLLVEQIEALSLQITRVETELERFSAANPAVRQLQTIPGVGRQRSRVTPCPESRSQAGIFRAETLARSTTD